MFEQFFAWWCAFICTFAAVSPVPAAARQSPVPPQVVAVLNYCEDIASVYGYLSYVWNAGVYGTLASLHLWLFQGSGGFRPMVMCSAVGLVFVLIPTLILEFTTINSTNEQARLTSI